jgi:hypothetical protein
VYTCQKVIHQDHHTPNDEAKAQNQPRSSKEKSEERFTKRSHRGPPTTASATHRTHRRHRNSAPTFIPRNWNYYQFSAVLFLIECCEVPAGVAGARFSILGRVRMKERNHRPRMQCSTVVGNGPWLPPISCRSALDTRRNVTVRFNLKSFHFKLLEKTTSYRLCCIQKFQKRITIQYWGNFLVRICFSILDILSFITSRLSI